MFPTINTNKENVGSGPLPQPHVKIIDLQHNLLSFESNSSESVGVGVGVGVSVVGGIGLSIVPGTSAGRNIIDT